MLTPANLLRTAWALVCSLGVGFDPTRLRWRCPKDGARFRASGSYEDDDDA